MTTWSPVISVTSVVGAAPALVGAAGVVGAAAGAALLISGMTSEPASRASAAVSTTVMRSIGSSGGDEDRVNYPVGPWGPTSLIRVAIAPLS